MTATAALFMLSAALDDTELLEYIGNALNTCPGAEVKHEPEFYGRDPAPGAEYRGPLELNEVD